MTDRQNETTRQLGGELVIPVAAVAFTLYFFSTIWNSPWTAQVSAFVVGGVLLAACGLFFLRSVLWLRAGRANLGFGTLISRDDLSTGRLGLFITTLAYVTLIDALGFTLTTFLFLATSMLWLSRGRNPLRITLVSAVMALGGWAVFIWAFDTRFPRGWFEETMRMVLANG